MLPKDGPYDRPKGCSHASMHRSFMEWLGGCRIEMKFCNGAEVKRGAMCSPDGMIREPDVGYVLIV